MGIPRSKNKNTKHPAPSVLSQDCYQIVREKRALARLQAICFQSVYPLCTCLSRQIVLRYLNVAASDVKIFRQSRQMERMDR